MGHQVPGVHAPPERFFLRTEKVTYTTLRLFENYQQILVHAKCNWIKSIAKKIMVQLPGIYVLNKPSIYVYY